MEKKNLEYLILFVKARCDVPDDYNRLGKREINIRWMFYRVFSKIKDWLNP